MVKKIILLILISIICIVFASCSDTETADFKLTYDDQTQACTVKNISGNDFRKLNITFILETPDGFEKEIVQSLEEFKEGAEHSFKIEGINEYTIFQNVHISEYTYDTYDEIGIVFIVVILILAFICFIFS